MLEMKNRIIITFQTSKRGRKESTDGLVRSLSPTIPVPPVSVASKFVISGEKKYFTLNLELLNFFEHVSRSVRTARLFFAGPESKKKNRGEGKMPLLACRDTRQIKPQKESSRRRRRGVVEGGNKKRGVAPPPPFLVVAWGRWLLCLDTLLCNMEEETEGGRPQKKKPFPTYGQVRNGKKKLGRKKKRKLRS